jgi:hypothetical protein
VEAQLSLHSGPITEGVLPRGVLFGDVLCWQLVRKPV